MAIEDIVIPQLGESITEGSIGSWLKKVGDAVAADEPIVEVETDKVAMEVPSPVAGVLIETLVAEGDTVEIGALIARVDTSGKGAAAAPAAAKAPEKKAEAAPAPKAEAPAPKAKAEPAAAPAASGGSAKDAMPLAPAVRRLVEEYNLDASTIPASGKDGRLTKGDVLAAIESGTAKTLSAPAAGGAVAASTGPREERVKMTRLRKRIAERLKEAQNTAAMLTTYNEVDMTAVMAARERYKDLFAKKHGIKLGFMSFFTKACCLALKEIPSVNAQIDGDEVVYFNYANIGVAVSAPNGLVVPVLKDAQNMSFADTELAIANYGKKARDGKLTVEDMQGGTFTISNGGIFGSLMSSPILNTPQSGILGMHKIQDRPVVENGQIVIRPMMYLALSYDHRLIDGREAVTFLVRVKEALEDPTRLLLDM
ncbi:2-oxoglutarate dehydrogenase complex dihydrolipoyllysine-residue succinyltransferase [Pseudokordiimonas caeni]|uniref:2-oxoglutarate dehydrogenase complex dihydrolipoyllysine-residue succinyltransferase n=1 Tax=Pseudokordiimonas caeni TaxID=2997908 RepID=UPI002811CEA6|nr:2-oxoglutarate dehydrogenase complex dihydrolipoyllysine-residue succinyltransferase [Pseudokordiimonas caeni]